MYISQADTKTTKPTTDVSPYTASLLGQNAQAVLDFLFKTQAWLYKTYSKPFLSTPNPFFFNLENETSELLFDIVSLSISSPTKTIFPSYIWNDRTLEHQINYPKQVIT